MSKTVITFEQLSMDLQLAAENKKAAKIFNVIVYVAGFGLILGMLISAKEIPIGFLLMFASAFCFLVDAFGRRIVDKRAAKIVTDSVLQGELCVSIERLERVESKVIEAPYDSRVRVLERKNKPGHRATVYYFDSGKQWSLPNREVDYAWAKYAFVRFGGLANLSQKGDEFYYVFLQNNPDIAYIYPCKYIELDKRVQKRANM